MSTVGDISFQYFGASSLWTNDVQAGRSAAINYSYSAGSPNIRTFAFADRVLLEPSSDGLMLGSTSSKKLSLWGAVPAVRGSALTPSLTPALTHTAPTPDYAIQDLANPGYGFVTKDEGNSVLAVVANLQTRVAEIEVRLQALGALP